MRIHEVVRSMLHLLSSHIVAIQFHLASLYDFLFIPNHPCRHTHIRPVFLMAGQQ